MNYVTLKYPYLLRIINLFFVIIIILSILATLFILEQILGFKLLNINIIEDIYRINTFYLSSLLSVLRLVTSTKYCVR